MNKVTKELVRITVELAVLFAILMVVIPKAQSAEVKVPKLTCKMVRVLKNKRIGKRVIKLSTFKRVCKVKR